MKLVLPEAKTAEEVGREKVDRLNIAVGSDETIYLDNKPVALSVLEKALRDAKEKNPKLQVQFSADKTVSYGTVVAIVDAAGYHVRLGPHRQRLRSVYRAIRT